jgi:ribosomal protein S18 acetylase RimI-like enzyme
VTTILELKTAADAAAYAQALTGLLKACVDAGASIGFLPPLAPSESDAYWREVFDDVARGARILLVAVDGEHVLGSVQLGLATKPNALHRGEVQKLIVHPEARRRGLGRALMERIEEAALRRERTLLVLDTKRGDDAERLYPSMGWSRSGVIPHYARNGDGGLDDTVVFYKELDLR